MEANREECHASAFLAKKKINYSQASSVGKETGYGLDGRGSIPGRDNRLVSTLQRPDRLWLTQLLSSSYLELFPRG
jgi:hypothetical protein